MRFLIFSLIISLFFFSSCASKKSSLRNAPGGAQKIDVLTRTSAQGNGRVGLLDHQLIPIDYLHKNPLLKGLLINHYMGTGKTYLGVGFAESMPNNPVLILAPKFLESHWRNQLAEYGVKNKDRFLFMSYDDAPTKLRHLDLKNYIVLADEVHNLIRHMRTTDPKANALYTEVYTKLRTAHKILALTGTPIYGDESDLAFIINLVSGQDLMPFNQEQFRLRYTKIIPARQFFRGYLTESNLVVDTLPFALSLFAVPLLGPAIGIFVGSIVGVFLPVAVNYALDMSTFKLREFDVDKLKPFMNKYVSYFRFDESKFTDFPALDFKVEEIPYNQRQYSFFLRLVEGDLPVDQLQRLLKSEHLQHGNEYVRINSTALHEQIYSAVGAGRDIGNFEFVDDENRVIEPPKFQRIFEALNQSNEQTVIYSNYYETGILALRDYLLRKGYQEKFAIIEPNLSVRDVNNIVASYNRGETKLLLLHPEITEGISLKGTQHLHILEPILNSTVLEQVVGRARRFQSHSHLPKDKQTVHVRVWQSTSSWSVQFSNIYRANWYKRYRELAYLSRWGIGLSQVDKNVDDKALNPEELAMLKLRTIEKNLSKMQTMLADESIENYYEKPVN